LPVLVTAIGWIVLIRGTILLFLSQHATARLVDWFRFEEFFYLYVGFAAALGFYITVHGFSAAATKRPPQSNHPTELRLLRSIRAHSDRRQGR